MTGDVPHQALEVLLVQLLAVRAPPVDVPQTGADDDHVWDHTDSCLHVMLGLVLPMNS